MRIITIVYFCINSIARCQYTVGNLSLTLRKRHIGPVAKADPKGDNLALFRTPKPDLVVGSWMPAYFNDIHAREAWMCVKRGLSRHENERRLLMSSAEECQWSNVSRVNR